MRTFKKIGSVLLFSLFVTLVSCTSMKEKADERHSNTKNSILAVIELVKKGNFPAAESQFYENANCREDSGCYEYIYKGENKRFRESMASGFQYFTDHIEMILNCSGSKNVKELEKCVRKQKKGYYKSFVFPRANTYNDEDAVFDVNAFCEVGLGGNRSNPEHNDLFRAIKWNEFHKLDEQICEAL